MTEWVELPYRRLVRPLSKVRDVILEAHALSESDWFIRQRHLYASKHII